jgi:predicted O-methyltransferase YrrM
MSGIFKEFRKSLRPGASLRHVRANVLTVRNYHGLKQAMGWTRDPILEEDWLFRFENLTDINDRRIRDAELLGGACANGDPKILLEIGTARGEGTAVMARNAPNATVYTVNIPPEEISTGGKVVTYAPSRDETGIYYREKGLKNIEQIFANTLRWEPGFGPIDVAFVDGCHDAEFVYGDTKKILRKCRPGSVIVWHDFAPEHIEVYPFMKDVLRGIECLYLEKLIEGRILHLQDSFMGIYKVPHGT